MAGSEDLSISTSEFKLCLELFPEKKLQLQQASISFEQLQQQAGTSQRISFKDLLGLYFPLATRRETAAMMDELEAIEMQEKRRQARSQSHLAVDKRECGMRMAVAASRWTS